MSLLFSEATSLTIVSQTLKTVVDELDKSLFDGYVKPRAEVIADKIHEAILGGHIDWYRAPQPKGKNNLVHLEKPRLSGS